MLEHGDVPWCRVNFCSTTAVTRPRTLAEGSLIVASTDSPTNWAIEGRKVRGEMGGKF